ncbi:hypothetical protein A9Q99_15980 [Gammaproteobacteria bacterium 45_16_T64]|nr:hypothetical protein A9Q99_15980 [Gammaproteobacteria bacterium 45_16_T64]
MHYYPSDRWFDGSNQQWESKVIDDGYFFAVDGKRNTKAEWEASIQAFQRPEALFGGPENPHAQCRFPARFSLIKSLLSEQGITIKFPTIDCPGYQRWKKKVNGQRATLVFASSYLNSPSSMFGHTFLRFDAKDVGQQSELLSYALNFGAVVEKGESSMLYAYKGLAGGYSGYFAIMPYYEKIKEYSKMENRSLWEYPLDLTVTEVDALLAHVWELRNIAFTYFFFDENCSYRLLELLEVAKPGVELTETFRVHAIPIDTVRVLEDNRLLGDSVYRASASDKLLSNAKGLSKDEIMQVKALAEGTLAAESVHSLAILNVAYQYLQFTLVKKQRDPLLAKRRLALLRAINKRSKITPDYSPVKPVRPAAPQVSHRSQMVAVRAGEFESSAFVDVEFRASYHDLLDPIDGYLKGGSINMGRVVLRQYEGRALDLEHIDFIDINSLSPQNALHQPMTWRVNVGVDRVYSDDVDNGLALQVNGGGGVSIEPAVDWLVYGLAEGRAEYLLDGSGMANVGGGVRSGVMHYGAVGTASVELSAMRFLQGVVRVKLTFAQNVVITTNSSVRVNYQYWENQFSEGEFEKRSSVNIGYRYHY